MLGKRPHQIQRTTSMSQLRAPPSARTRAPCCTPDFAHARKPAPSETVHNTRMDCTTSLKGTTINHGSYPCKKAALTAEEECTMKPKVLEDTNAHAQIEMKLEAMLPQKNAPHTPLQHLCSSPPVNFFHDARDMAMAESFLEACFFCKRPLGHGRDIFMYRGDAAFCTEECRSRQMSSDERGQKFSSAIASRDPSAEAQEPQSQTLPVNHHTM